MPTPHPEEEPIAIKLAPRHWALILKILNDFIQTKVMPRAKELQRRGVDPSTISEAESTILAGSLIAQGLIVKELAAHGVMTKEADDKLGIDALTRHLEESERREREGN